MTACCRAAGVMVVGLGAAIAFALSGKKSSKPLPGTPQLPGTVPKPDNASVVLIGDSYAVGLIPVLRQLSSGVGTQFEAFAEIGTGVTHWVLPETLYPALGTGFTHMLISLGANDYQRSDGARVRACIGQLVAKVKQAGMRPLWIEPLTQPPTNQDKNLVRATWGYAIASGDIFPSSGLTIPRQPDGIHPYGGGYNLWGELVWSWLCARVKGQSWSLSAHV